MTNVEYSSLQRVFTVGEDQIQVYIYRQQNDSWRLHLVNAHGASLVCDKHFSNDEEALMHFEDSVDREEGFYFPSDPENIIKEFCGINVSLLEPQYKWYRDIKSKSLYTLCKFDMLHKYVGLWPAQSLLGHKITGYLYRGDAPKWPHAPKGLSGSPDNIEVEFTVLPKHIDFYIENERNLRDSSYWQN
jgi:hypothetical protein